jgi:lipopolysaccharide/colanic/teichoic acid biosynthesis glycosyltransferase
MSSVDRAEGTFLSSGLNEGAYRRVDNLRISTEGGLPVFWGVNGPVMPVRRGYSGYLATKRILDVAMSIVGLIVLAPLLAAIALVVKVTSEGPALFVQSREGRNGRPFNLLKFRTFYADHADNSGMAQTTDGDRRVTPFGRFLRRVSFDELPQLWNVLIGDMSVVGPRPHVDNMLAGGTDYRTLVPYYELRLAVRPGLTGWAQANGLRGPTVNADRARARIDYDIAYIQNMSLWLDIKIIFLTIWRELAGGTGL